MPGLHPFPQTNCVRFTLYQDLKEKVVSFQTYWEPESSGVTPAILGDMASDYMGALGTLVAALMVDDTNVVQCRARFTNETTDMEAWSSISPIDGAYHALVGANEEMDPVQDALIVQRKTGKPGRQHRGRIFISGLAEEATVKSKIDGSAAAAAKAIADYLGADRTFGTILCHARHWNRKDNTLDVITQCRALFDLGSRRDRAPKGYHIPIP